jgi:predicted RNA-binding Zn-ribbon protein involved in translation (DUF1610 family)
MPFPDFVALAILPSVIWASLIFVWFSRSDFAIHLRSGLNAKTKQDLAEAAQSWTFFGFLTFSAALAGVLLWTKIATPVDFRALLVSRSWPRDVFHGAFLGLALIGLLAALWKLFPPDKRFRFLVMTSVASPPAVRALTLVFVALTEELWRAVCLRALVADGISGPRALLATSAAYGFAYFGWGIQIALSDAAIGAVFGALFLWSGSFFVPLAAHLTLRGQHLLASSLAAPNAAPGEVYRSRHANCPACGAAVGIRQINLNVNEAFFCPACGTRITVSDRRRRFIRWGYVLVQMACLLASWDLLPRAIRGQGGNLQYWMSIFVACGAAIGLLTFYVILVPPRLECGDADFIRLNLDDKRTPTRQASVPREKPNAE